MKSSVLNWCAPKFMVALGHELPPRTSFAQALILALIVEAHADGRNIRVSDLARLAGASRSGEPVLGTGARHTYQRFLSTTPEVPNGLGWIRLEPDPQDGRAKLLRLTEAGMAVADRVLGGVFASGAQLEPANDEAARVEDATSPASEPPVGWSPPPTNAPRPQPLSPEERRALHKVYTDVDVARDCLEKLRGFAAPRSVYVEPSAGDGAFLKAATAPIFGLDIAPEHPDVVQFDFLAGDIRTQIPNIDLAHLVVVGNPPFGTGGKLALEFLNRALSVAGLVGFIVPISFRRFSVQSRVMEGARLIHDSEIAPYSFTRDGRPYNIQCCFQVWSLRHPDLRDRRLSSKPSNIHPDFEVVRSATKQASKRIREPWSFAVPRVGNVDYAPRPVTRADFAKKDLFLFRSDDPAVIARLKRIDFAALARRHYTTHAGFSMADVVAEYEALLEVEAGRAPRVEPVLREPKPPIDFDACNGAHLIHGDCLDVLSTLPDHSVDVAIADPPYGTTGKSWDTPIPLQALWSELRRVVKPTGSVILFAAQPFTSDLVRSNRGAFRYVDVWQKDYATNHWRSKREPMKIHEDIVVFTVGARAGTYNPQGLDPLDKPIRRERKKSGEFYKQRKTVTCEQTHTGYPTSIIHIPSQRKERHHEVEKPIALMRRLVRTYSDDSQVVLDFCMGSGTTGVAARMEGRRFIGVERDPKFFETALRRIEGVVIDAAKQERDPIVSAPTLDVEPMVSPLTLHSEPIAFEPILDAGPRLDPPTFSARHEASAPAEVVRRSWREERRKLPVHLRVSRQSFNRHTAKRELGVDPSIEWGAARARRWRRKRRGPAAGRNGPE